MCIAPVALALVGFGALACDQIIVRLDCGRNGGRRWRGLRRPSMHTMRMRTGIQHVVDVVAPGEHQGQQHYGPEHQRGLVGRWNHMATAATSRLTTDMMTLNDPLMPSLRPA